MDHPGDIIITAIIITGRRLPGHRIIDRRLPGRRSGRLPDHPAVRPGRQRGLQEDKIAVILYSVVY